MANIRKIQLNSGVFNVRDFFIEGIYVMPEEFGSVGDGVTDDTEALRNAINSGKNVLMGNKTYKITSSISIPSNITIIGEGTTIIDSRVSNVYGEGIFTLNGASNVSIVGVNFSGKNTTPINNTTGIAIWNCDHVLIDSCKFVNFTDIGSSIVEFYSSHDCKIVSCDFKNYYNIAIGVFNGCYNIHILSNNIYNRYTEVGDNTYGIVASSFHSPYPTEITYPNSKIIVDGNFVDTKSWEAIDAHGGDQIIVTNNVIINSPRAIALFNSEDKNLYLRDCIISNNTIRKCEIGIVSDSNTIIDGNIIDNASAVAINCRQASTTKYPEAINTGIVSNNHISNSIVAIGGNPQRCYDITITGNKISKCSIGLDLSSGYSNVILKCRGLFTGNSMEDTPTKISDSPNKPSGYHDANMVFKVVNNVYEGPLPAAVNLSIDIASVNSLPNGGQRGDIVKLYDGNANQHLAICTQSQSLGSYALNDAVYTII